MLILGKSRIRALENTKSKRRISINDWGFIWNLLKFDLHFQKVLPLGPVSEDLAFIIFKIGVHFSL